MKKVLKILFVICILLVTIGVIGKYIILANMQEGNLYIQGITENTLCNHYEENIVAQAEANDIIDYKIETIDLDDLIVKDEKYTQEYKTKNGESYTIIGSLKIDKLNIEYDIFSSTSVELLKMSLNKYWGAMPNEIGNMCIVGHNYLDKRFFGRLHTLQKNDVIEITDEYGLKLKYYVYDIFIADPYDTRCTSQLTNGNKEITLITCYNKGTQRLVVKARAKEDKMNMITKILRKININ